jgi:hypothetical protein
MLLGPDRVPPGLLLYIMSMKGVYDGSNASAPNLYRECMKNESIDSKVLNEIVQAMQRRNDSCSDDISQAQRKRLRTKFGNRWMICWRMRVVPGEAYRLWTARSTAMGAGIWDIRRSPPESLHRYWNPWVGAMQHTRTQALSARQFSATNQMHEIGVDAKKGQDMENEGDRLARRESRTFEMSL